MKLNFPGCWCISHLYCQIHAFHTQTATGYWRTLTYSNISGILGSTYVEPGQGELDLSRRLLYFVETAKETPRNLCIKFVRRYGKEVHDHCARRQIVPALYGFDTLHGGCHGGD